MLNEELLACPTASRSTPSSSSSSSSAASAVGPAGGITWAHAEALAFASLLTEGIPIRLTGQDTERGTFSQRHLVLHDPKTGQEHCAMQHLPGALAPMELHNSPLSEMACLGLRVRLLAGGARDAGPVGGAVRRLRQRRPGDHRPVHHLGPGQVGPDLAADAAAAARLRGLGSRALLGAPRALPPARRRGQHPRRQPDHAGAVLPPAAPSGADRQAAPAGGHDAQEPAASAAGYQQHRRSRRRALPAGAGRARAWTRSGDAADPLHRQGLLRPHGPRRPRRQARGRDRPGRAALPVPPERDPRARRRAIRTSPRSSGSRRSRATWAPAPTCPRGCCRSSPTTCASATSAAPSAPPPDEGYPVAHAKEQNRIVSTALDLSQPVSQYPRKQPGER